MSSVYGIDPSILQALQGRGYTLVNQVHTTNFGGAFLAQRTDPSDLVFIKISNLSDIETKRSRENPKQEAAILRHLHSRPFFPSYFPTLLDEFTADVYHFCVLENCGKDLCDLILASLLSKERILNIWQQLVHAVHVMHSFGICHLDLKPENILIKTVTDPQSGNEVDHVRICDFGQACETGFVSGVYGTHVYRAPESELSQCFDGAKADLYSLGVVLFTMLIGGTMYDRKDRQAHMDWLRFFTHDDARRKWIFNMITSNAPSSAADLVDSLLSPCDRRASLNAVLTHKWTQQGFAMQD